MCPDIVRIDGQIRMYRFMNYICDINIFIALVCVLKSIFYIVPQYSIVPPIQKK